MSAQDIVRMGRSMLPIYAHYQLNIHELNKQLPLALPSVLRFSSEEQLSTLWRYAIEFTSPLASIPTEHVINQPAQFLLHPDGVSGLTAPAPREIHGVITAFRELNTSADETRYEVVLEPRLKRLAHGTSNAIYQNKTVIGVVEDILRSHYFSHIEYRFDLTSQYPVREFFHQHNESDYAFISRLLADVGVWFRFEYDIENHSEVVVFGDSAFAVLKEQRIPYRHPAGLYDGGLESVWETSVQRKALPKQVTVNDENYRKAQQDMLASSEINRDSTTARGDVYLYGEHYFDQGKELREEPEEGRWYAKRRSERFLTEEITFTGQSTAMELKPGMWITTPGKTWADAPRGLLIISTQATAIGRSTSYSVTFTAIPFDEQRPYRPPVLPWPKIAGTIPARVSSPVDNPDYAELDTDGRYRVVFGFDLNTTWKKGFESLAVRLMKPYAGDTYGWHFPLLAKTSVMIGFVNGDPDRPFIVGSMHDSRSPDLVTLYNHHRNVIRTPRNNKIRLDDKINQEHIKIATEYGKSEVNLGHMVRFIRTDHPAGRKEKRGEGLEAKTNLWGSVRAEKGLLLTAHKLPDHDSDQLSMQEAKALLSSALIEMQTLSASAQQAQALAADIERQKNMLQEKLDRLQQAVLLGSAPHGVALVSGENLQLSAADNLTFTAGKQMDVGVIKDFTLAVGKQISLYSSQGAKMFASRGDIDIQAQGGNMTTWSTQDTHISSGKKMVVTAQDELTLICGGGYIKLKGGNVEIGGPGKLLIKNGGIQKRGAASMQGVMKSFEPESFDEKFVLRNALTKTPLANKAYAITMPDGSVIKGITDASGATTLNASDVIDDMRITLLKGGQ